MNRALTWVVMALAAGGLAAAISLHSCVPGRPDLSVLAADPSRIKAVRLRSGGEVVEIKRQDGGWTVASDGERDRADRSAVAGLLQAVAAPDYFDRIPAGEIRSSDQLADYGLKSSKRWIEVEERSRRRVLIGKETPVEGRVYARLDGGRDVFVVAEDFAALADLGWDAFRDRALGDFAPGSVDRVVLRTPRGEVEIAREPGGWRLVKPLAAPASAEAVEKLLQQVASLPILKFEGRDDADLGTFGIVEGRSEIAVFLDGRSRPLTIRFGREVPENPDQIYAQLTARDCVVRVAAAAADLASRSVDALRDPRLLELNLDTVDRVRVSAAGESVELSREGDGWVGEKSGSRFPASPGAVSRLAEVLGETRALEFRITAHDLSRPPDARVEFLAVLSENTPEELAGEQTVAAVSFWRETDSEAIARIDGRGGAAVVPSGLLDLLSADPSAWSLPVSGGGEVPGP